jgi:hypothetical protein
MVMPEIWFKCDLTSIALDIKLGDLLAELSHDFQAEEDIAATLGDMAMSSDMLIVALSRSKPVQRVTQMLRHVIQSRSFLL